MMNRASLQAVAKARIDPHMGRPLYDSYCFSQLPSFISSRLTGTPTGMPASVAGTLPDTKQVVLFLVDGFGWTFLERFADELPFLRRFFDDGIVSKLTTQFPTTTAAQMTTLHTGLPVGRSGIPEWFYYEPAVDGIFAPLLCMTVQQGEPRPVDSSEADVYPSTSLYRALAEHGVRSYCYQSNKYAHSPFSRAVTQGANVVPFRTLAEATVHLADRLASASEPTYHCVYFDVVDATSHTYGPDSAYVAAEIRTLFAMLESIATPALADSDVLVLVSADHGHTRVDPSRIVHLENELSQLEAWFATDRQGRPVLPGGSPRDLFIYLQPDRVDDAYALLSRRLESRATVHRTAALADDGYFGDVRPALRERLGGLTVLPRPHEMVWWHYRADQWIAHRGHHGGLSADELEIPLLVGCP